MLATTILIAALVLFAFQAVRARRLLVATLWLAGTSALLSVLFYSLGAYLIAVIELSVGAGLVTVLFAFAISIAGEEFSALFSGVPRWAALLIAIAAVGLIGYSSLPLTAGLTNPAPSEATLSSVMWDQRGLDVLVQLVLIFAGVLGLLGLLAETKAPLQYPVAEEYARMRDQELLALDQQVLSVEPELQEPEKEVV